MRGRKTRGSQLLAGVVALICALSLAWVPVSTAAETAVAPRAKVGIAFVLTAPPGVSGQLTVTGPGRDRVVRLNGTGKVRVVRALRPGTYRLKAARSVLDGREYVPSFATRTLRVVKGKPSTVSLRWVRVTPPAGIEVTETTTTAVSLAWQSATALRYVVRRTAGEVAPVSRTAGTPVYAGSGLTASDTGLEAGKRYSYSLWAKFARGVWRGPVSVTAGTIQVDPETGQPGAAYALAPRSFVVDESDSDVVEVIADKVYVTLAKSRPGPVIGAGIGLAASEALPGGFLGTIDQIGLDGRTVRLAPAGVADVFDHYDISGQIESDPQTGPTVEFGEYDADTDPGNTPTTRQEAVRRARIAAATPKASTLSKCIGYNPLDLRVRVDPTFDVTGDFDVLVHTSRVGVWKAKADVARAITIDLSDAVTIGALVDVELKKELTCFLGLEDFYKQFTAYPVPMGLRYSAGLEVRGFGKLNLNDFGFSATAGYSAQLQAGIGVDDGFTKDVYKSAETYDPIVSGEIGMEAAIMGELTVGPGAGSKDVGAIAGVGGALDIFKFGVTGKFGNPVSGEGRCVEIGFGGAADLKLTAQAWAGPLEYEGDFELWQEDWDYGEPKRFPDRCVMDTELGDGDVRATLRWTNGSDYDLHVVDTGGNHIYYSTPTSPTGGALDVDIIPGCDASTADGSYVENVNWPQDTAPVGTYTVFVNEYAQCGLGSRTWTLEVTVDGRRVLFETGSGTSASFTFQVPEAGG